MKVPFSKEVVVQAVSESLENMLFMEPEPTGDCSDECHSAGCRWAKLGVTAPYEGEMTMICPEELAVQITESLFGGSETTPNADLVADAMAEILNTVAGRLLGLIVPESQVFKLGLPQTGKGELPASTEDTIEERFLIEGKCFCLRIRGAITKS